MPYQKVKKESYGGRVVNSFKGIGVGVILLLIGTLLLFWNEGRAVRMSDAINEAREAVVEMTDIGMTGPAFEGRLVFASGKAETGDIITDPLTGVSVSAVSLERRVEYYQWVETSRSESRDKLGGGKETVTTYDYNIKWVNEPVDSSKFEVPGGHENKAIVQIASETLIAPNVSFGAYQIPEFMKGSIGSGETVTPGAKPDNLSTLSPLATISGGAIYIGRSPSSPEVGDVRITYIQRKPCEISLIAVVRVDTFAEFTSSGGTGFWLVANGVSTPEAMLASAEKGNSVIAWILRGIGTVLVMVGFGLIFAPLKAVAMVVPLISNVIGAGTGLAAILLGFAWSFIIIAVAWVRYRPVLGIGLLATALLLIILLSLRGGKRKRRLTAVQPANQPYQAIAQRFCPGCGQPQNPESQFCANCGSEIR